MFGKNCVIKVMTLNLLTDCGASGANSFDKRILRVVDMINTEMPDIIGFQEVTDRMRKKLCEVLVGYTLQGCGRDADCHGEAMTVAYRTDVFELLALENIWLSPTPGIPGSRFKGDQSLCPRMLTSLRLKHRFIDRPFRFINTHFDHVGSSARCLEAAELSQVISLYKDKFILTGDFNATPDTPEIDLILSSLEQRNIIDCTKDIKASFHGLGKIENHKIDYIFTDGSCKKAYAVEDVPVDGTYFSDHNPLCAEITL
ncbi:MAG: endonuclease/exonuclease/phosphatase family protein [Clostridia bacterium]|nr:endonuclease/exonuclease/phosphatase family protein [Clostridia bacterium]MBQ9749407.1 endonuclease/exonuclease/phosphatase family protein [Clostridia bacterium]